MTLRLVGGSPGRGSNSVVQCPDHWGFSGNMEDTPIMTASSQTGLNSNNNSENIENDDFPALKSSYDR